MAIDRHRTEPRPVVSADGTVVTLGTSRMRTRRGPREPVPYVSAARVEKQLSVWAGRGADDMADLDYRWRLREVMAKRGMFSTTDLRPLLAARGVDLSASQVYRLVVDKPERLNLRTLMALLDIFDCTMEDLIEPPLTRAVRRNGRDEKTVRPH